MVQLATYHNYGNQPFYHIQHFKKYTLPFLELASYYFKIVCINNNILRSLPTVLAM